MEKTVREALSAHIIKHYAKNEQVCKLGWTAFQAGMSVSSKIPITEQNYQLVRDAFYMGIQHIFSSFMQTLGDEGSNEDADMIVMHSVGVELHDFLQDFLTRHNVFEQGLKADLTDIVKEPPKV